MMDGCKDKVSYRADVQLPSIEREEDRYDKQKIWNANFQIL